MGTTVSNAVPIAIGDTIDITDYISCVLNSVSYADAVYPSDTSSFYNYYQVDNTSNTYLVFDFDMTNYQSEAKQINTFMGIKALYMEKYSYSGFLVCEDGVTTLSNYSSVNPLTPIKAYYIIEVPKTVIDSPFDATISMNGNEYQLSYKTETEDVSSAENKKVEDSPVQSDVSQEEEIYQKALQGEERLYYAYAAQLYGEILDYKDSTDRYNNLMAILAPYNGTYKINMFGGGVYDMTIQDGHAVLQIEVENSLKYCFDILGYTFDGKQDYVSILLGYASDSNDDGIPDYYNYDLPDYLDNAYVIHEDDGQYMLVALEGNEYKYFNGSGSKVQ